MRKILAIAAIGALTMQASQSQMFHSNTNMSIPKRTWKSKKNNKKRR